MSMMQDPHNSAGFSLPEMMIATTISLIVLAGVIGVFGSTVKGNSDALKSARLNQELRAIMDVIVRDVRRAGYTANAPCTISAAVLNNATVTGTCGGTAGQANPFAQITVTSLGANADCITYSYDREPTPNGDGAQNTSGGAGDERYGFRLDDGAAEIRQGGATCDAGGWQDLSDPASVTITRLTFSLANSPPDVVLNSNNDELRIRQVDITLEGQLQNDATVRRSLTESVRVRNDIVCPGPAGCV